MEDIIDYFIHDDGKVIMRFVMIVIAIRIITNHLSTLFSVNFNPQQ